MLGNPSRKFSQYVCIRWKTRKLCGYHFNQSFLVTTFFSTRSQRQHVVTILERTKVMIQTCLYSSADFSDAVDYSIMAQKIKFTADTPKFYTVATLIALLRQHGQSSAGDFLHDKLAKLF